MKLILLGPPGAGKGTQAKELAVRFVMPHISTGVILRDAIQKGTELGNLAKSLIDGGNLVPDSVMIDIVRERIGQDDCSNGFLLDGFPRTIPQAETLESISGLNACVAIDIADDVIVKRLVGRRDCPVCSIDYNIYFSPPEKPEKCDSCGGDLNRRADDNEESITTRLKVYRDQTRPLIDHYGSKGLLRMIDGLGTPAEVLDRILAALQQAD